MSRAIGRRKRKEGILARHFGFFLSSKFGEEKDETEKDGRSPRDLFDSDVCSRLKSPKIRRHLYECVEPRGNKS